MERDVGYDELLCKSDSHSEFYQAAIHSVFPLPFKRGGTQILKILKRGGNLKIILGWGKPKGGREVFSKIKGRTQLFKLNLGIEKNKNGDFEETN